MKRIVCLIGILLFWVGSPLTAFGGDLNPTPLTYFDAASDRSYQLIEIRIGSISDKQDLEGFEGNFFWEDRDAAQAVAEFLNENGRLGKSEVVVPYTSTGPGDTGYGSLVLSEAFVGGKIANREGISDTRSSRPTVFPVPRPSFPGERFSVKGVTGGNFVFAFPAD